MSCADCPIRRLVDPAIAPGSRTLGGGEEHQPLSLDEAVSDLSGYIEINQPG
jgi:hypothetical protein